MIYVKVKSEEFNSFFISNFSLLKQENSSLFTFRFSLNSVLFSNLYSSNLARDGLWQFIYEFDDARIFIRGSLMLHMILQFLDEVRSCHTLVFFLQYDGCLDNHTSDWVWYTGDGALYYGRMSHQGIFYLERTDAIT